MINNDGNMEIRLFLKLSGKTKTLVHIALDTTQIPSQSLTIYQKQTQDLILDFKKKFYWEQYQKVIDTKTIEAKKIAKKYKRLSSHHPDETAAAIALNDLLALDNEIEQLKALQLKL